MIPGLSLIGSGSDSCIIDTRDLVTSQNFTSVTITENCLFKGFHIFISYNAEEGVGISGTGNLENSIITHNSFSTGYEGIFLGSRPIIYKNNFYNISIGIEIFNSNAIVRKNNIYTSSNSQLAFTAGVYIQAFDNNYAPIVDSNYITLTKWYGIRKAFGTYSTIKNNIIILMGVGTQGMFLGTSDSGKIYNNFINAKNGHSGIENIGTQFLKLYNNYVTGNFSDNNNAWAITVGPDNDVRNNVVINVLRGIEAWGNENLKFQYNNVWNNRENYSGFTPDTTNISVNPMVINDNPAKGDLDFHLQMFSPLIDAGDPSIIDKDSSRSDIGLYGGLYGDVYNYLDLPPHSPVNLTGKIDTGIVTLKWNPNTEADFSHYKLFRDTIAGFTSDSANLVMSLTDTFYSHIIPHEMDRYYYKLTAVDKQENESETSEELFIKVTDVKEQSFTINNYRLFQNYPNPFNPSTKIGYRLKERGYVKLYVYDVKGELVSVLVNQNQEAGYYEAEFDARYSILDAGLASGIYIYQIMVRNENDIPVFSDIRKMVLVK
jgi:hypothetical protein